MEHVIKILTMEHVIRNNFNETTFVLKEVAVPPFFVYRITTSRKVELNTNKIAKSSSQRLQETASCSRLVYSLYSNGCLNLKL
ncbi:hypothetical protein K1719_001541 [Acacia pycnantha]|nr:hypothetical protein K1719_001541 [Acacia pycnantha]